MRACRRRVSDLVRRRTWAITVPTLSAKLPARTLSDSFSWFGRALGYPRRGGVGGCRAQDWGSEFGQRFGGGSSGGAQRSGLGLGLRIRKPHPNTCPLPELPPPNLNPNSDPDSTREGPRARQCQNCEPNLLQSKRILRTGGKDARPSEAELWIFW